METIATRESEAQASDLRPHLLVLLEDLTAIHDEQESINARSTACAFWHAAQTCKRFIAFPAAHSPAAG